MKITIGVTTFNRRELLQLTAESLARSASLEYCNIRIYDDCSDQFSVSDIKNMFPVDVNIIRREKNIGADENMRRMYIDFLDTGDDALVNCDADLLFRGDWIQLLTTLLPQTDGVLSLYNSSNHPCVHELRILETPLVEKEHLGSAGTVFSREIVAAIVHNVPSSRSYDWDWSRFLRREEKRLLCTRDSYVQHIGLDGHNSGKESIDYGLRFFPQDEWTMRHYLEFNERLLETSSLLISEYKEFFQLNYWFKRTKLMSAMIEPLAKIKLRLYGDRRV